MSFEISYQRNKTLTKSQSLVTLRSSRKNFEEFFRVINEKRAVKWWLYTLKINKSAVKYSVKFQCIVILTDWNNDILVLQYYWELSEDIKDEIVWRDCSEEL